MSLQKVRTIKCPRLVVYHGGAPEVFVRFGGSASDEPTHVLGCYALRTKEELKKAEKRRGNEFKAKFKGKKGTYYYCSESADVDTDQNITTYRPCLYCKGWVDINRRENNKDKAKPKKRKEDEEVIE